MRFAQSRCINGTKRNINAYVVQVITCVQSFFDVEIQGMVIFEYEMYASRD